MLPFFIAHVTCRKSTPDSLRTSLHRGYRVEAAPFSIKHSSANCSASSD